MNLDSTIKLQLVWIDENTVADLTSDWDDGSIAALLEGDPETLAELIEEAVEFALVGPAVIKKVEVDDREIQTE